MRAAAALVLFALLASGCASPVEGVFPPMRGEPTRPVWLVQHGWHTRVAVQTRDVDPAVWPESEEWGDAAYLEVGWGDAAFYPAEDPGILLALNAALRPTPAVLHVRALDRPPREAYPGQRVVRLHLSPRGFERLTRFIHDSYARDTQARPVRTAPAHDARSAFYAATGRYHLLNTSNTWSAAALRAAGAPVAPRWTITAGGVMCQAARAAGAAR